VKEARKSKVAHPKEKERMAATKIFPQRTCFKRCLFRSKKKIKNQICAFLGQNSTLKSSQFVITNYKKKS